MLYAQAFVPGSLSKAAKAYLCYSFVGDNDTLELEIWQM